MDAVRGADRNATIAGSGLCVAFATLFHGSLLRQLLLLVHRPEYDSVFGAPWRKAEAPSVLPYRIGFLLRYLHRYRVRFLPRAYIRPHESIGGS